jgi:hypothetical protein
MRRKRAFHTESKPPLKDVIWCIPEAATNYHHRFDDVKEQNRAVDEGVQPERPVQSGARRDRAAKLNLYAAS